MRNTHTKEKKVIRKALLNVVQGHLGKLKHELNIRCYRVLSLLLILGECS